MSRLLYNDLNEYFSNACTLLGDTGGDTSGVDTGGVNDNTVRFEEHLFPSAS